MIISLILNILRLLRILIVIRAIVSWIPMPDNRVFYYLRKITEPMLQPIRKLLWRVSAARSMPVDISPVIAYLILTIVSRIISQLYYYGTL